MSNTPKRVIALGFFDGVHRGHGALLRTVANTARKLDATAAAFTFFYGKTYDRKGFRTAILPPVGLLMAGFIVLYCFRATVPVFIGTLIMLCGYLSGMAIFGAMLRDRTPAGKAGMFQGQRIIGQVLLPGVIGPAIGAAVLKNAETVINDDGTTSFVPNENIFLAAFAAAACIFIVLIPLFQMLKKEKSYAE